MITKEIIEGTAKKGLPELKVLFEKLSPEDALKGLGLLAIIGVASSAFIAIKEIVLTKTT